MRGTLPLIFLCSLCSIVLLTGCGSSNDPSQVDEIELIIPGERIGPFVLGRSTRLSILGRDTPEKREKYRNQGLEFSFNRANKLRAITIHTNKFETSEGVKVGSPMNKVRKVFGDPLFDSIEDPEGNYELPGYVYDGITFLEYEGNVAAIIVMEKVEKQPSITG